MFMQLSDFDVKLFHTVYSIRNYMKFFDKDGGLNKEDIARIIEIANTQSFIHENNGSCTKANLMDTYSRHLYAYKGRELSKMVND